MRYSGMLRFLYVIFHNENYCSEREEFFYLIVLISSGGSGCFSLESLKTLNIIIRK